MINSDHEQVLRGLPRGDEVCGLDEALAVRPDDPEAEDESITRLRGVLADMSEDVVAIVCHWGNRPTECRMAHCRLTVARLTVALTGAHCLSQV